MITPKTGFKEYDEGLITLQDLKFLTIQFLGFYGWLLVIGEVFGQNDIDPWPWIAERIVFWIAIFAIFTLSATLTEQWLINPREVE